MRFLLLLTTSSLCIAQSVSIGVKAGIRTMDDIANVTGEPSGAATSESKRYIVGPMLDLGLPLGFGAEVDALYNREGYDAFFSNFGGSSLERERGNAWQFPLLLKYRLPFPAVQPYAEAGYAFGILHGTVDGYNALINLSNGQQTLTPFHLSTNWQTTRGFVVGLGAQLGFGRLRVSPEIRYTQWNRSAVSGGFGSASFQSAQNQLDVLVGVGWRARR
jgi:hypothetical protein